MKINMTQSLVTLLNEYGTVSHKIVNGGYFVYAQVCIVPDGAGSTALDFWFSDYSMWDRGSVYTKRAAVRGYIERAEARRDQMKAHQLGVPFWRRPGTYVWGTPLRPCGISYFFEEWPGLKGVLCPATATFEPEPKFDDEAEACVYDDIAYLDSSDDLPFAAFVFKRRPGSHWVLNVKKSDAGYFCVNSRVPTHGKLPIYVVNTEDGDYDLFFDGETLTAKKREAKEMMGFGNYALYDESGFASADLGGGVYIRSKKGGKTELTTKTLCKWYDIERYPACDAYGEPAEGGAWRRYILCNGKTVFINVDGIMRDNIAFYWNVVDSE